MAGVDSLTEKGAPNTQQQTDDDFFATPAPSYVAPTVRSAKPLQPPRPRGAAPTSDWGSHEGENAETLQLAAAVEDRLRQEEQERDQFFAATASSSGDPSTTGAVAATAMGSWLANFGAEDCEDAFAKAGFLHPRSLENARRPVSSHRLGRSLPPSFPLSRLPPFLFCLLALKLQACE